MQIKRLHLYSSQIDKQHIFYKKVLGLEIIAKNDTSFSVATGDTILQFSFKKNATPYHFAINIPCNKEIEALEWLKDRVTILKDGEHEIQLFEDWNAKAVYFYDEDKNIVELIARKNLQNDEALPFSQKQFLYVSEIGLPSNDNETIFRSLNKHLGLDIFDGGFERFCAIGDEEGLIIAINKNVKDWFPVNNKAYSSEFKAYVLEKNTQQVLSFQEGILEIASLCSQ